jgi:hypothetical protein
MIDASEAYNDSDAIRTFVDGRRDVAFITTSHERDIDFHITTGLKRIKVTRPPGAIPGFVLYRDKAKANAMMLLEILNRHNGYANDKTPEEAMEIGRLLGYTEESIRKYVSKKYYSCLTA